MNISPRFSFFCHSRYAETFVIRTVLSFHQLDPIPTIFCKPNQVQNKFRNQFLSFGNHFVFTLNKERLSLTENKFRICLFVWLKNSFGVNCSLFRKKS